MVAQLVNFSDDDVPVPQPYTMYFCGQAIVNPMSKIRCACAISLLRLHGVSEKLGSLPFDSASSTDRNRQRTMLQSCSLRKRSNL